MRKYSPSVSPASFPAAFQTLQALRSAGVRVQMHASAQLGVDGMKAQFKRADASGARYALVFGERELAAGLVTVKSLRDGSGAQFTRGLANVGEWAPTLQSQT